MTGFAELPVEAIALEPTEQRRSLGARAEIIRRDKYCSFPVLDRYNKLIGLEVTCPAPYGDVHHITPISFLQMHRPQTDPNHPLNLICLDGNRHNMLHREWIDRYQGLSIRNDVYLAGKAGWLDDYDEALTNIALIRTRDYLEHALNISPYYERFADEVYALYENMDQHFLADYRRLVERYPGLN